MTAVPLRVEDLPHYTYEDYSRWEGKWEIINGIPYAMAPTPVRKHQTLCLEIAAQLKSLLANCNRCTTYLPIDWQVTEETVVQPDVLVVCDEDSGKRKLETTPVVVFEILSPSTSHKDKGIKYRLYESAGVRYYCIVDPDNDSVEVYVLQEKKYESSDVFKDGKMLFDLGPCQIAFDFKEIFKK
ncbi:MAG: Uma2 family endonuclease [bacterium]|nr:Uma2 family endonuclease [bacterium]